MAKTYSGAEVKQEVIGSGVRLWQVAEKIGISEFTFSRKLRHDFTEDEHHKIVQAIDDIINGK